MWPTLFHLGPFTLHSYGALVAAGFIAAYFFTVFLGGRNGVPQNTVLDLCWISLLSGLAGARVLYVLFNWPYFAEHPIEIPQIWQGGLVWYGGLIGAVIAGLVWLRRRNLPVGRIADVFAPGVALGHTFGRLGCFSAGCCYGRPTAEPWAVVFRAPDTLAPLGVPIHPSQLYESALDFLLFLGLAAWALKRPARVGEGRIALVYVVLYGLIRMAVEFTRGDDRGPVFGPFTSTQWVAVASAAAAVIVLLALRRRHA